MDVADVAADGALVGKAAEMFDLFKDGLPSVKAVEELETFKE